MSEFSNRTAVFRGRVNFARYTLPRPREHELATPNSRSQSLSHQPLPLPPSDFHSFMSIKIRSYRYGENPEDRKESDDTQAFENAIQSIAERGGGRLVLPPAHYRIRPINLTSHFILHLQNGARLTAVPDGWPLIPPLPSYGRGRDHPGPRYSSLLHCEHCVNVTIVGEGRRSIIDGNGHTWWDKHHDGSETITRGHLVEFLYSTNIAMHNLTLRNSPFWTNHFFDCDHVHVKNVHIFNPDGSPNTDGWDPDSSRNVLIEDSSYRGADDCVAIKSGWDCFGLDYAKPCVNITIRNVTCHGVFAGIAIGSEMSGGVENVTVENVRFTRANKPANIKVGNTRGGYVKNVVYRNLSVEGKIDQAIHVDAFHYYNNPNPECPQGWKPVQQVQVTNISFVNINGRLADIQGKEVFHFAGLPDSPLRNLHVENVYFEHPGRSVAWNCNHLVHSTVKNVSVTPWPPCPQFDIIDNNTGLPFDDSSSITCKIHLVVLTILVFQIASCRACRRSVGRRNEGDKRRT